MKSVADLGLASRIMNRIGKNFLSPFPVIPISSFTVSGATDVITNAIALQKLYQINDQALHKHL